MKPEPSIKPRRGGRPLSFDRAAALRRAMLLFWRHGYEGTSVADLTSAMGITPPSLYAAFGDKKRLFLEAVDLYTGGGTATAAGLIAAAPTSRAAALDLLRAAAVVLTGEETPPGCLLTSATASCSAGAADVQEALASIRRAIEAALRARVAADVAAGALPPGTDAAALAKLCVTVIQGMSTQARDGASREDLLPLVELAMRAWPAEAT